LRRSVQIRRIPACGKTDRKPQRFCAGARNSSPEIAVGQPKMHAYRPTANVAQESSGHSAREAAPMWATAVKMAWQFYPVTCMVPSGWSEPGRSFIAWLVRGSFGCPRGGGRSGLASTHSASRRREGVAPWPLCSGTGLLSQMFERGLVAGSCRSGERARGPGDPPRSPGGVTVVPAALWWLVPGRPARRRAGGRRG